MLPSRLEYAARTRSRPRRRTTAFFASRSRSGRAAERLASLAEPAAAGTRARSNRFARAIRFASRCIFPAVDEGSTRANVYRVLVPSNFGAIGDATLSYTGVRSQRGRRIAPHPGRMPRTSACRQGLSLPDVPFAAAARPPLTLRRPAARCSVRVTLRMPYSSRSRFAPSAQARLSPRRTRTISPCRRSENSQEEGMSNLSEGERA